MHISVHAYVRKLYMCALFVHLVGVFITIHVAWKKVWVYVTEFGLLILQHANFII